MKELIELLRYTEVNGDRDPQNYVTNLCGSCYLCEQAADALERLEKQVPKWIPVTERLPEVGDTYLVVVKYKYDWEKEFNIDTDVAMFVFDDDGYIDNCWNTYIDWDEGQQYIHITHWMPLPEPPKGE